jgi:hypothetical protein
MSSVDMEQSVNDRPSHEVGEYEDAEINYQPKSLKFWAIMAGMYVSIFLVALVSILTVARHHTTDLKRTEPLSPRRSQA